MTKEQQAIIEAVRARREAAEAQKKADAVAQPVAAPAQPQAAAPVAAPAPRFGSYGEGVGFDPRTGLPTSAGSEIAAQTRLAARTGLPALGYAAGGPFLAVPAAVLGEQIAASTENRQATGGEMTAAAIPALVPGGNLARAGLGRTLYEGSKLATANVAGETAKSLIDHQVLPTLDVVLDKVKEGFYGAGLAKALSKATGEISKAFSKVDEAKLASEGIERSAKVVRESGYKLPSVASPVTGAKDTPVGAALLKASSPNLEAKFVIENQKNTNRLAAKYAGIEGKPVTEKYLNEAASPHNAVYDTFDKMGGDAKKDLSMFKQYRDKYHRELRDSKVAGHSEKFEQAMESKSKMEYYERRLETHAAYNETAELYQKFQTAREALAKINATREAANLLTGEVDATIFRRMKDRGVPLTDEGEKIAMMAEAFPDYAVPASKLVEVKKAGLMSRVGGATAKVAPALIGGYSMGPGGAMLGAGLTGAALTARYGAQKAVDAALLSRYYQMSKAAQPYYGIARPDIPQNLARYASLAIGRENQ